MRRDEAEPFLDHFLNAVTSMATGRGPLKERLAWVTETVVVFCADEMPEEIRDQYIEFLEIIGQPNVPESAKNHPDFPKRMRAYYLSPPKAKKAAELLISILEKIVYANNDADLLLFVDDLVTNVSVSVHLTSGQAVPTLLH